MAVDVAALAEQLVASLNVEVARRVDGYAARVEQVYQHEAPRDTGRLASAFTTSVTDLGAVVRLHGEVDDTVAPYGKFLDDPPAEIVPRNARVLRWFNAGAPVFARSVTPSRVHEGWWARFVETAAASLD